MSRFICKLSAVVATLVVGGVASAVTLPVTAGLTVRLMADAGTGQTLHNSPVSTWTDQSGNGNSVFQGTGPNQPLFRTAQLNGLPTVHFDGDVTSLGANADYMRSTNPISNMFSNNAYTTFVVLRTEVIRRNETATNGAFANDTVYGDSNGYMGMTMRNGGPQLINYNFDGNEDTAIVAPTLNQFQMVTAQHNGTSLSLSILGGPGATVTSGNTGNLTGMLGLSAGVTLNQSLFTGDIAELLIYNVALNPTDRGLVQAYLNEKWFGVTVPEPSSAMLVMFGVAMVARRRASR